MSFRDSMLSYQFHGILFLRHLPTNAYNGAHTPRQSNTIHMEPTGYKLLSLDFMYELLHHNLVNAKLLADQLCSFNLLDLFMSGCGVPAG